MQITRAKATALLNKGEMQLYDDSRHNPIRKFSASQLESRITRARSARDRARDLVRRQKLDSRKQTGSKRGASGNANQRSEDKVEILADILTRFETRLGDAKKAAREAGNGASDRPAKRAAKKAAKKAVKKPSSKTVKKVAARSDGGTPDSAGKRAGKSAAVARKAAGRTGKRPGSKGAVAEVTPQQALRSTHQVLEAKQEAARQPKPWQEVGTHAGQVASEGFQNGAAARRALDLHAGEARMPAIHGSAGTRGRITQGKRDSQGSGD